LALTGDYLRLWSVDADGKAPKMKALLNMNRNSESCAPLTSFDWNETDPTMIGTCSIDTTCTIWDIEALATKRQLIAHDREVYDISFARGKDVFGTVGADGSVRMFDLRSLEHSMILYETPDLSPLLRIAWNKQDPNYLAVIATDSYKAIILDIRMHSHAVAELVGHQGALNGLAWAPHSSCHICTIADDRQALIWDVTHKTKPIEDPILAYTADSEVNQLQWCQSHVDWVAACYDNKVQILRV
jgi:WD repeat-containing protein 68